jgi:hypothetical protein
MAESQQPTSAQLTKPPPELSSILTQVQTLQSDRERLQKELEEARQKMDKLQVLIPFPPRFEPSLLLRVLFRRRVSARR